MVALKCLDKKLIQEKRLEQQIIQEIENQKMIKHPNVIQLYNYFDSDTHLTLILEFAPHGDLFSRLKTYGIFREQDTAKYVRDVCSGLAYLHQKRIIHRDVKLENIFLGLKDEAKIGDFGCSLRKSYKTNSVGLEDGNDDMLCGTLDYLAPEMIRGARYNEKVDSWAIGVVIYECVCGYAPFGLDDSKESYGTTEAQILEGTISFPDHLSEDCIDLITKLLTTDPSKRLAVRDTMNHPFIKVNHNKRSLLL